MLIVHNAIRYSSPRTQVTIGCSRNLRHAVIEVSDRGQGIAAEHRAKILDRFYRVDKASSRAKGGHGLGLAIAKWSVEHQGGRIEVQSEVGKGGTFRIVLPV
jgi:signal transduction histidine kinase